MKRDGFIPSEETLNHPSELECLKYDKYDLIIDTEKETPEVLDRYFQ